MKTNYQARRDAPVPVLEDGALYLGDNGTCLCGACSGASARFTGRDISGQQVERVRQGTVLLDGEAFTFACERCGKEAPQ